MTRVTKKTPGGRIVFHERREKTSKHTCAICKAELHGTPRGTSIEIKRLNHSERKPSRPFAGRLCSICLRKIMSLRARVKYGEMKAQDVPISLREYVK